MDVPVKSLYNYRNGAVEPPLAKAEQIVLALGLEFYVGPPCRAKRPLSAVATAFAVQDSRLAEALTVIVEHWEALDSDYAREDWLAALYATSAKLGARRVRV